MRKKFLLFLMTALLAFPSMAQDFEYEYEGQTVAYTVLDENAKTCITRVGDLFSPGNHISGKLVLPTHPKFDDVSYTLTEIGAFSFTRLKDITSIEMPNTVTKIGDRAFSECSGLTEVTIPNSVTEIGSAAFTFTGLTEVTIPNSVTELGAGAFAYNSLTKITIPDSVKKISDDAFQGCSLTEVTIPNSVIEIGGTAFLGCTGLTKVTIPDSVKKIGGGAFLGCEAITEVNYITDHPKIFDFDGSYPIFSVEPYSNAILYVRPEGLELAAETEPWKYFKNIQAKDFDAGVEQIIGNSNDDIDPNAPMEIYTLDGKSVSSSVDTLAPGIYIVHQGSLTKKIVVK